MAGSKSIAAATNQLVALAVAAAMVLEPAMVHCTIVNASAWNPDACAFRGPAKRVTRPARTASAER